MSIKRIFVPIPSTAEQSCEIETAVVAAKALDAYLEALFIAPTPPPASRVAAGAGPYGYGTAAARAAANDFAAYQEQMTEAARERFTQMCAAHAVPVVTAGKAITSLPAAAWRTAQGAFAEVAARRAAAFDLIVAASAAVLDSLKEIAERSLLHARRPVLLAPARLQTPLTGPAMIAWDESPECWHAVSAALPFLRIARSVQLVSVDRDAERRAASQADALAYLRCHGIEATARVVAPHLRAVGDTLLATAAEEDIGLLVMGAYSHSRLREMLLGGATHDVLQNANTRPVLLMH
jgi:nucleotide-binding universal stress UspA family protein